jgi:hypothetical protein
MKANRIIAQNTWRHEPQEFSWFGRQEANSVDLLKKLVELELLVQYPWKVEQP